MPGATVMTTLAVLLLSTLACSDPGQPALVPVEGVKVAPQSIQFTAVGQTQRLVATLAPADASDQAVSWESTDAAVASVNNAGLVTANGTGSGVFITVVTHDGHHEASANVSVEP
jgi:uncharacterized protein YjdB